MPYGSSYVYKEDGNILQLWNGVSQNPFTVAGNYPAHAKTNYIRSGTNAPKGAVHGNVVRQPTSSSYEWRYVSVPMGKRLAYKVYSKRLGRYVWARRPILIRRLVKVKLPKRKKIKGLDLPPNALSYSGSTVSYFSDISAVTCSNGSSLLLMTGSLWAPFLPFGSSFVPGANADNYLYPGISSRFSAFVSEADSNCIPRLYEKVKQQDVNLAQALNERRQTVQLLVDLSKRLLAFWTNLKKFNLRAAISQLLPGSGRQLANDWLAIQYGIKPLLSDLEGITKSLTKKPSDVIFDIKVRKKIEVPRELLWSSSGPSGIIRVADEVTSFGYVEVVYKYRFKISSPGMAVERELTRLGFSNLNSLAWESIPFSFVFDWFLPIGNYLNNSDAFDNLTVVHATKTVFQKEYIEFRRTFGGAPVSGYQTSSGVTGFVTERVKVDRVLTGIPELRFPSLKDPISKIHILNAIALISQLKR